MSQFRKEGLFYVSQWNGDDSNSGTDPTAPIRTLDQAVTLGGTNNLMLFGPGVYKRSTGGLAQRIFEGDGKVVFDLDQVPQTNVGSIQFRDLHIKNCSMMQQIFTVWDCFFEDAWSSFQMRGDKTRCRLTGLMLLAGDLQVGFVTLLLRCSLVHQLQHIQPGQTQGLKAGIAAFGQKVL